MLLKNLVLIAAVGAELATAAFNQVTAKSAWAAMNPGWNLGNTLDAFPGETSWGNPLVSQALLDSIKAAGIKSIRLPVTWANHFTSEAPDYKVDAAWMDRVEQVIDWSLERGFWIVVNLHHDSHRWADLSDSNNLDGKFEKFEKLWVQIADKFKNKNERLILESLNEPLGSTQEHAKRYNDLNQRFVNIIRGSGGYNKGRLLTLPGLNTNIQKTVDWFKVPTNADPWILHVHDYDPQDFISTNWGRTFWGTDADKKEIEDTFISLQKRFNAPVLVGEWGLNGKSVEKGASWAYFDFFVRAAKAYNLTFQLWDNGEDHYDRVNLKWRDPVKHSLMINAAKGIPNAVPSFNQPATIYHKAGATVTSQNIALEFNGNTISSITNDRGKTLKKGTEYTITSTGITISAAYLRSVLTGALGSKDTLTIAFNRGARLPFEVRIYDKPTVSEKAITVADSSQSLLIPVDAKGSTLATVKAVKSDGAFLKDDWTQWLGPLQQGRIGWGDFGVSGNNVVIYSSLLQAIKNSGGRATLTLEYWPRTDTANNAVVTVTVS